ncbi:MAG: DUF3662 and FHA domain-containing protein [Herpetosiphon sp.]
MSALSSFEGFMERMVEGSVQRLFRSPIQPSEIARRLERAMESQQTISVDRVIVPSFYRAFLNPDDYNTLAPIQNALENEMSNYLRDLAQERGFTLLAHPTVDVAPDTAVPRRGIQVVAEMGAAAPNVAGNTPDRTQVIPTGGGSQNSAGRPPVIAQLVLNTSQGAHAFPLDATVVTVGRGLNNDLIVEDARVSRQHAQLRFKSRRYFVSDIGSTNGTFLNGAPLSGEQPLRDGDVVSFGGLEMNFRQR